MKVRLILVAEDENMHQLYKNVWTALHYQQLFWFSMFYIVGQRNGFTPRFLGFSLYVSNTTDISKGSLCYKDTGYRLDTIPAVFNTTCPVHGQYVIYHNERLSGVVYPGGYSKYAFNELCEVEVFGKSTTYKLVSLYLKGYPNMGKKMISCVFPTCAYFIYQCNKTFASYMKQFCFAL